MAIDEYYFCIQSQKVEALHYHTYLKTPLPRPRKTCTTSSIHLTPFGKFELMCSIAGRAGGGGGGGRRGGWGT